MTTFQNKTTTLIEDVENDDSDSGTEIEESNSDSSVKIKDTEENGINSDSAHSGDSGEESASEQSSGEDLNENAGWADSLAKILKSNKPRGKKSLVLSRAKKMSDIKGKKNDKQGFEVISEDKEGKPSVDVLKVVIPGEDEEEPAIKKRKEDLPDCRVKPTVLDKTREKVLSKIATRGVVQLFNAVRNQQKDLERKSVAAGPLDRKKEKALKSLDKVKFLDGLMGQSKSAVVNESVKLKKETKKEIKDEETSTWSVFRDDFMMGAKMKDWDKKDKANDEDEKVSDLSDSDSE